MRRTPADLERIRETAVKLAVDFCSLSRRILRYANRGTPRADFLREVSRMILDFSTADALELRMTDGELRYRWSAVRDDGEALDCERLPGIVRAGRNLPCRDDESLYERLCAAVILDELDHAAANVTGGGSFWLPGLTDEVCCPPLFEDAGSAELERLTGGYASLALIAFHLDETNTGLLVLKSRRERFLSRREIEFYEGLAETLGVAVADRRAQHALRERIKELTCLYGIAKLVQRPGIELDELLQGIVELMPPAWQYPELASARLVLDDETYTSPDFDGRGAALRAEIDVGGRKRGFVEIIYSGGEQYLEATLFLEEERSLIEGIAQQISLILDRRHAERERRRLQEQLRHADRLATIGQLGAGVAHELNEPLTSILGFAQLAAKQPELPGEVAEDLELIIKSSLHAREIVKKLLFFSRQMPSRKTAVDLNETVEHGLYFLESRCAKEGIELVRRLDDELPPIIADPSQLHQVLVNLVVNAIQAVAARKTSAGPGRLTIATDHDGARVYLRVSDNGVGMDDQTRSKIFLPFFTTKDVGEGTGLGLPVVYGIVTGHGGSVEVQSTPGHGSTFTVALPRSDVDPPNASEGDRA